MNNQPTVFIGYDAREHEAACIAAYSLARRANEHVRIYVLEHMTLRRLGLFDRTWRIDEKGQFFDERDTRPFSTAFSHSRFLAFHLASELECTGPCMFVDCDWLFLDDIGKLMQEQAAHPDRIGVVMRDRKVDQNSTKMDGMLQQNYSRKLWSALFTFMPSPDLAKAFAPDAVNSATGRDLHAFLSLDDDQFWDIDPAWHYIPSLDEAPAHFKGIHFSEFSPWLNPDTWGKHQVEYDFWEQEHIEWLRYSMEYGGVPSWRDLKADLLAARA